jgi:dephospho-CoA kinase
MLVVGLTGDIGAGKTTLADFWERAGASVIDADAVVDEIWKQGILNETIRRRWGASVFSSGGEPDHSRIASIVFNDEEEYQWLARTIHPMVRSIMEGRILSQDGWVVAEIPLLFENGAAWWVDETVYLSASLQRRIQRNNGRKWAEGEMKRREKWLLPSNRKMELADYVLNNDENIGTLYKKAMDLGLLFRDMASCVTLSTEWESESDAREYAGDLLQRNMVAFVDVLPAETGETEISASSSTRWRTEAVTVERFFREIMALSGKKGKFARCERIRRTDRMIRDWIREAHRY